MRADEYASFFMEYLGHIIRILSSRPISNSWKT